MNIVHYLSILLTITLMSLTKCWELNFNCCHWHDNPFFIVQPHLSIEYCKKGVFTSFTCCHAIPFQTRTISYYRLGISFHFQKTQIFPTKNVLIDRKTRKTKSWWFKNTENFLAFRFNIVVRSSCWGKINELNYET